MARKISTDAADALINFRKFHIDNTEVIVTDFNRAEMQLFGNTVAIYETTLEGNFAALEVRDCRWFTKVTRERINEVVRVFDKNIGALVQRNYEHVWLLDGKYYKFPGGRKFQKNVATGDIITFTFEEEEYYHG
jgi:hypothetical protein